MSNFENTMLKIRCHIPKLTTSGSNNNKSQDNFLSVFDCLSVWWGKRDQSTWAVFTEPMSYIVQKSIVSKLRFVRTRPQHWSQGQRCTGRIGEQRESQKGQSDAQILIVETNELRRVSSKNTLVTMPLPGAAVARRFAKEGFTVAVARYSLPHLVTITTAEEFRLQFASSCWLTLDGIGSVEGPYTFTH